MRKRESSESIARKAIEEKIKSLIEKKQPFTIYTVEQFIYAEMDAPSSEISITNYHKLRNYFLHRYGIYFAPGRV